MITFRLRGWNWGRFKTGHRTLARTGGAEPQPHTRRSVSGGGDGADGRMSRGSAGAVQAGDNFDARFGTARFGRKSLSHIPGTVLERSEDWVWTVPE